MCMQQLCRANVSVFILVLQDFDFPAQARTLQGMVADHVPGALHLRNKVLLPKDLSVAAMPSCHTVLQAWKPAHQGHQTGERVLVAALASISEQASFFVPNDVQHAVCPCYAQQAVQQSACCALLGRHVACSSRQCLFSSSSLPFSVQPMLPEAFCIVCI